MSSKMKEVVGTDLSDAGTAVTDAVKGLVSRLDLLASKLGVAATEIWKFTVLAKIVDAKKDFAQCLAGGFLALVFLGWALHVATMNLPHQTGLAVHDAKTESIVKCVVGYNQDKTTKKITPIDGTCRVTASHPVQIQVDNGIKESGWAYIISGIVCFAIFLIILGMNVFGMIEAIAAEKKAEYTAYQDILSDLEDLRD